MAVTRIDQGELLTALHSAEGARPFATFLERLRRRMGARRALLVEHRRFAGWIVRHASTAADDDAPSPLSFPQLPALRAGRVYGFDELDLPDAATGRVVRCTHALGDAWLVAADAAAGFRAADSALLAGLAVHVAIAAENHARLDAAEAERAAMQGALDRAGVGWALLDASGAVIVGDAHALPARTRAALVEGEPALAIADTAIALPAPPAARDGGGTRLALYRTRAEPIDRARAFAARHALPASEARIAVALAEGRSIAEAAADLGLTIETARHYTKRLYAATGARGQADLVRLFWTGPAALA